MIKLVKKIFDILNKWLELRYTDSNLEYLFEKQDYENWLKKLSHKKIIEYEKEAASTQTTLFEIYKRKKYRSIK